MNSNDMILAIYTMMFVFVLYMSYKIFNIRKQISGERKNFSQKSKILQYVLIGLLLAMIFMVEGLYLKILLLGISTYFVYNSTEKITLSESGIYFNGRLEAWDNIKQWTFNDKTGQLVVTVNSPRPGTTVAFPTKLEDKEEINKTIRQYKSKKKK